VQSVESA